MNALKSAFKLSKNEPTNPTVCQLYEEVKSWDQARAKLLQNYMKVVLLALDALDGKVGHVEKYIEGMDKLMTARIQQITTYCKNGVNDSQFFLVPSPLTALKPCHQLLKHLLMQQSQREQTLSSKGSILTNTLQKLKHLKQQQCTQNDEEIYRQGNTIRQLKSNIRFLIDCQLPDLNEEVIGCCRAVSNSFQEDKNFYISVQKFVKIAEKQLEKYRDIGQELLSLVDVFSQREKQIRIKLREILMEWVNQDLQDKIFKEQLAKNPTDQLINEYYDLDNLIPEHSQLWQGQSLEEYLKNFQILPFREHQRLVVYSRQVFYNGKIEAKVVLTLQKQAYLFRIGSEEADFTFTLSKSIKIRQKQPLILVITQTRKTLLMRQQKDFEFTLQFNLETDMKYFQTRIQQLGCILQKK